MNAGSMQLCDEPLSDFGTCPGSRKECYVFCATFHKVFSNAPTQAAEAANEQIGHRGGQVYSGGRLHGCIDQVSTCVGLCEQQVGSDKRVDGRLAEGHLEVTHVVLERTIHRVQPGDQLKDLVDIGSKTLCFARSASFKDIDVDSLKTDILVGKRRAGDTTPILGNANDTTTWDKRKKNVSSGNPRKI